MATFTLEQLKKRHPNVRPKKTVSFEDIQRQAETRQQTTGNQFGGDSQGLVEGIAGGVGFEAGGGAVDKFFGKARDFVTDVVGGGKLAEGLGLGLAAPKLQRQLSESEQAMSDTDLALVRRIQEKKKAGEDTTRLEQARNQLIEDMKVSRDVQEDFVESLPSNQEVIGSAIRLGGTLVAPTIASNAMKATALGRGISGVGSGILRGAGAGAAGGAVEGGVQGLGIGIEKEGGVADIALSTVAGAAGGAAFGGALGSIGGIFAGRRVAKEEFANAFVLPKATEKVKREAIRGIDFDDPGFFRAAEIKPTGRERKLAEAVSDVVSKKNSLSKNLTAIDEKISEIDAGVEEFVRNNKVPFNRNQVRSQLNKGKEDLELVFASEANAEKTFDKVVDVFVKQLKEGDTSGLLKARKGFDNLPAVRKLLETDIKGENARKEIVLAVRTKANEYVASLLPKGNTFRKDLLREHYMLEALGNAASRETRIIGKNKLQLLTEKYPALKWIVGGAVAATLFGGGVGAGSSIIGSTD